MNVTKPKNQTADNNSVEKGRPRREFSKRFIVMAVVVILIILGVLGYAVLKTPPPHIYKNGPAVKFTGPAEGKGIVFNKPTDFTQTMGSNQFYQIIGYQAQKGKPETTDTISLLIAPYVHSTDEELTTVNSAIVKSESSPEYKNIIVPIESFSRLTVYKKTGSPNYFTTLSKAKPFQNKNINSNAWQFDVSSVTNPKTKSMTDLQGKAIYAYGQKAIYMFVIITTKGDWDANSTLWQQTLSDLKIEQ